MYWSVHCTFYHIHCTVYNWSKWKNGNSGLLLSTKRIKVKSTPEMSLFYCTVYVQCTVYRGYDNIILLGINLKSLLANWVSILLIWVIFLNLLIIKSNLGSLLSTVNFIPFINPVALGPFINLVSVNQCSVR